MVDTPEDIDDLELWFIAAAQDEGDCCRLPRKVETG